MTDGALTRAVEAARAALASRHRAAFLDDGVEHGEVVQGARTGSDVHDDLPFGARLRAILPSIPADGGLIVLGSGAVPLLTTMDRRAFIDTAAADRPGALANDRYSADIVAIARARDVLADVPIDLPTDNVLPRWLVEVAGVPVADRRRQWRLGVDIDGPLDLVLLDRDRSARHVRWTRFADPADLERVVDALARVRTRAGDPHAEILVAGRTSSSSVGWLERRTAARTRVLIEERGLRTAAPGQRPAASALGALMERDGPAALGTILARLCDAAIVDSRVLLAHRAGTDERNWPGPDDRFASDLLLHERIADPWLRDLTRAAATAPIPIVLGGHTLVGPGLRLALGGRH
jgi:hypothetical protein